MIAPETNVLRKMMTANPINMFFSIVFFKRILQLLENEIESAESRYSDLKSG